MTRPLAFLVNARSGGQAGGQLQTALAARFPGRVHAIGTIDTVTLCRELAAVGGALIACGGDGTASHALDAAWQAGGTTPVGIIPLGTGNDLARSLGWGGATPTGAALEQRLAVLSTAASQAIDRWQLNGPDGLRIWFNYWSIGVDAQVALGFHRVREQHPRWFRHRLINQAVYGLIGLAQRPPLIALEALLDHATPPRWAAGVVVTNIASWAGGVQLHPRIHAADGRADAFALAGGIPLGLVAGRLRRPHRLGSRPTWAFAVPRPTAMQCDGEPFLAPPGRYQTHCTGQTLVLSA